MNIFDYGEPDILALSFVHHQLSEGHSVRVVDSLLNGGEALLSSWSHANFEFVRGDLRDHGVLKTAVDRMDVVVHLAAIVGDPAARQPELARCTNLEASDALRSEQCRRRLSFMFASTRSNYGKMKDATSLN